MIISASCTEADRIQHEKKEPHDSGFQFLSIEYFLRLQILPDLVKHERGNLLYFFQQLIRFLCVKLF